MGLFDDDSLDEQLWTDAWIDEVNRGTGGGGTGRDEWSQIQAAIDSGFYSREEIMDMFSLDESELDEYDDTFLLDD